MSAPLRAAVIGCGRIGSLLERDTLRSKPCTHASLWARHEKTELIAGCDTNKERREEFQKDWNLDENHLYEDYRDLLANEKPEIVSVATWTDSHAEITLSAAESGAKIILCEKPIALSLAEADAMISACKKHGTLLAVHHERRWTPQYRAVKELIESGELGNLRTIIGNVLTGAPRPEWQRNPALVGGGPALHDGTHLFDMLRFFAGEARTLTGQVERLTPEILVEDRASAWIQFEQNAQAFVEGGGRRRYFNFEMDIQCEKGRILIGNAVRRLYRTAPSPRYEDFIEFTEAPFPEISDRPWYYPAIVDDLLSAYETGGPCLSTGEDGRAALELVFGLYRSALAKAPVRLPLTERGNPLPQLRDAGLI